MDYLKITITTDPEEEWFFDSLSSQLCGIGFESFLRAGSGLEAYIPEKDFKTESLERVFSQQPETFQILWEKEVIKTRNWNEVWEKNYFKPLVIKNQCLVRAPFHTSYPECRYEVIIEPNMAFGTGNHETTSMMIELLLDENLTGKAGLDMGCGTGILSILASMLGAKTITAVDIDERACKATVENAKLNRIKNIKACQGDASLLGGQNFDFILANIQRNILLADMEKYVSVLNPGAKLFMSGFYEEDLPAIKQKAESLKLTECGFLEKNSWVAATFKKSRVSRIKPCKKLPIILLKNTKKFFRGR